MKHQFTSHNLQFLVEADGFIGAGARADFETISQRIEHQLDAMPATHVARLHAAAIATPDGQEAVELDDIGNRIGSAVTADWHNPDAAIVSLIAIQE